MLLTLEKLPGLLKKNLAPLYWVYGEEPFLRSTTLDAILAFAKQSEFSIEKFEIDSHFDIQKLIQNANTLSLFSSNRLFYLQFKHKLSKTLSEALLQWVKTLDKRTDVVLFEFGKIEKAEKNLSLLTYLEKEAHVMACWPIERLQLPNFIIQRAKTKGLDISTQLANRLCDYVEGNLLALEQLLSRVQMIVQGEVKFEDIKAVITDSARFDIYDLSEACLMGKPLRALMIYRRLIEEDVEMTLILWVLTSLLKNLNKLSYKAQSAPLNDSAFFECGIFKRQHSLYRQYLSQTSSSTIVKNLSFCAQLDAQLKSADAHIAQMGIEDLIVNIAKSSTKVS